MARRLATNGVGKTVQELFVGDGRTGEQLSTRRIELETRAEVTSSNDDRNDSLLVVCRSFSLALHLLRLGSGIGDDDQKDVALAQAFHDLGPVCALERHVARRDPARKASRLQSSTYPERQIGVRRSVADEQLAWHWRGSYGSTIVETNIHRTEVSRRGREPWVDERPTRRPRGRMRKMAYSRSCDMTCRVAEGARRNGYEDHRVGNCRRDVGSRLEPVTPT